MSRSSGSPPSSESQSSATSFYTARDSLPSSASQFSATSRDSLPSFASQSSATARDSLPSSASQSSATESGYETDIYTDSEEPMQRVNNPKYLLYVLRTLVIMQNQQREIDESHILAIMDKLHNNAKSKQLRKTALTYLYLILTKESLPMELTSTDGVYYVDEHGIPHHPDQTHRDISDEDIRIFDTERRIAIEQEEKAQGHAIPLDIEDTILRLFVHKPKRTRQELSHLDEADQEKRRPRSSSHVVQRTSTNGARGYKKRSRKQVPHKKGSRKQTQRSYKKPRRI